MINDAIIYMAIFAGWGLFLVCGSLVAEQWEKNDD